MKMKYNNNKTILNNISYDSKREAKRHQELLMLERAGVIQNLQTQVKYELQPSFKIGTKTIRAINYIADFIYTENGKEVVEDSKGFKTKDYIIKSKMFAYKYGIEIKET